MVHKPKFIICVWCALRGQYNPLWECEHNCDHYLEHSQGIATPHALSKVDSSQRGYLTCDFDEKIPFICHQCGSEGNPQCYEGPNSWTYCDGFNKKIILSGEV